MNFKALGELLSRRNDRGTVDTDELLLQKITRVLSANVTDFTAVSFRAVFVCGLSCDI